MTALTAAKNRARTKKRPTSEMPLSALKWLVPAAIKETAVHGRPATGAMLSAKIALVSTTALRLGETLELRWKDVDLELRTVMLRGLKGRRVIPFDHETAKYLVNWRRISAPKSGSALVFGVKATKPASSTAHQRELSALFDKMLQRHAEDSTTYPNTPVRIRWNDLRYFAISKWRTEGISIQDICARTGHSLRTWVGLVEPRTRSPHSMPILSGEANHDALRNKE